MDSCWTRESPQPGWRTRRGLLWGPVRRDLGDLNRWFLELALWPEHATDPRFDLPSTVRDRLAELDPQGLSLAADCPFALFELHPRLQALPASARVADQADTRARHLEPGTPAGEAFAFGQQALAFLAQLIDSAPHAARLAFGLPSGSERSLAELTPSRRAMLASSPGLVRPRWSAHPRFWPALVDAVAIGSATGLQWVHWLGLCLPGSMLSDRSCPRGGEPLPSRKPRG
ncbi:MAG TPA: hypothetical protein VLM41_09080 [Steroidobacteraceae bacterium]|nr:hypothetical protein [Steroidobacteraceae bacterium]